jgi:hypothetical protein
MTKGFVRAALFGAAAVLLSATASLASQWDQHVDIINWSGMDVTAFYATNTGVDDWGHDRLTVANLHSGYQVTLNIEDGSDACSFDFRAVLANGEEVTAWNMDVCAITEWEIRR